MPAFQRILSSKLTDLNPVVAGYCSVEPGHVQNLRPVNYTLIHYIRCGRGTYYVNDKSYSISAGACYITLPGQPAQFVSSREVPLELEWVGFTGQLSHDFSTLSPVFPVPEDPFPHLKERESSHPMLAMGLAGDLFHFYYSFLGFKNSKLDYVAYIADHIRLHYMEKLSVEDYARQFGIDRRHMSAQFKKKTGYSVQEYITKTRIDEAMAYLSQGYSGKEVAKMCGYRDAHNFYKAFKKTQRLRPSAWKERQVILTKQNLPPKSED